jgi:hypothetical protein
VRQTTVSHRLRIVCQAGAVTSLEEGRFTWYRRSPRLLEGMSGYLARLARAAAPGRRDRLPFAQPAACFRLADNPAGVGCAQGAQSGMRPRTACCTVPLPALPEALHHGPSRRQPPACPAQQPGPAVSAALPGSAAASRAAASGASV